MNLTLENFPLPRPAQAHIIITVRVCVCVLVFRTKLWYFDCVKNSTCLYACLHVAHYIDACAQEKIDSEAKRSKLDATRRRPKLHRIYDLYIDASHTFAEARFRGHVVLDLLIGIYLRIAITIIYLSISVKLYWAPVRTEIFPKIKSIRFAHKNKSKQSTMPNWRYAHHRHLHTFANLRRR